MTQDYWTVVQRPIIILWEHVNTRNTQLNPWYGIVQIDQISSKLMAALLRFLEGTWIPKPLLFIMASLPLYTSTLG